MPSTELALEKAGLRRFFQTLVTAEDECDTPEQTYLVGSIKVRRPPERCVVVEDTASGIAGAHDAMMRVIALVREQNASGGALRNADMRIGGFDELSLMSLREVCGGVELR